MLTEKLPNGQYRIRVENLEKPPVGRRLQSSFFHQFTDKNPTDTVTWTKRNVSILGDKGNIVFEANDVEFPDFWSDTACKIVASKYFMRNEDGALKEKSLKDIVNRICYTITFWGTQQGYFANRDAADSFTRSLEYILIHQIAAFNSPVWFNVGVNGNDPAQCSACFINSVEDSMESILDLAKTEGLLFKWGSGTGTNFSTVRSSKERTHGGGMASGPLSFMKGFDSFAGVIKSGGKVRRAAKMVVLNADHPDIFEFINCKSKEEKKAKALIAAGYDSSIGGEAYDSVSYQNANNSVRVTDEFMRAVEADADWDLKEVSTGNVYKTVKARSIMHEMAKNAWECGDPGIQYHDTINKAWPVKDGSIIHASNPCSEVHLPNDSACNLASINLINLKNEVSFVNVVPTMLVAMDILIDNSTYPTAKIAENSYKYRPLGLGYTNLGTLLMTYGAPYGSPLALQIAERITQNMNTVAWDVSNKLGSVFSTKYNWTPELNYVEGLTRNSQVTVLAPTGTISFMMDAVTTGIEPEFSLIKYKTMVGGGVFKTTNPIVHVALANLGYTTEQVDKMVQHLIETGSLHGSGIKEEHEDIFVCANPDPVTGKSLSWQAHVNMMAAVQPHISGAISKTVNLPESATVEEIEKIYIDGWKKGLKCLAVYRNNSKGQQPLTTKSAKDTKDLKNDGKVAVPISHRKRMPETRHALNHKFSLDGHEFYITVGLYDDGTPGELFIRAAKEGSTISGLLDGFATVVSMGLQHGVPLESLIEKLKHTKFEPAGFTGAKVVKTGSSCYDYIGKWLEATFIKNEPKKPHEKEVMQNAGTLCPACGGELQMAGTCGICPNCGTTGGCS